MAQTLHGFTTNLLTDPQAMAAYQHDPVGALAVAGLDDITPQDVQEVMPLVMDSVSVGSLLSISIDAQIGVGTVTPIGELAAVADVNPDGTLSLGVWAPDGSLGIAVTPAGSAIAGTGVFSSMNNLAGTLDSLDGVTSVVAGAIAESTALLSPTAVDSDPTSGASNAASSLGVLATGGALSGGALTDPLDNVGSVTDITDIGTSSPAGIPDLPIAVPQAPLPGDLLPSDVSGLGGVPSLPGLSSAGLPPLDLSSVVPGGLPLSPTDLPLAPLGTVSQSPVGDLQGGLGEPTHAVDDLMGGLAPMDDLPF